MTLKDVARVSGCSVATVSKAFKNSAEISESTKARVIKAAKQVGYLKKATSKAATLGGQRPIIFADATLKYKDDIVAYTKLFERYDLQLIYVLCNTKKAEELALQIGAWGVVTTESSKSGSENLLSFSGDKEELSKYLKKLSSYVPKRAPRSISDSKQRNMLQEKAVDDKSVKKQEDIWLL